MTDRWLRWAAAPAFLGVLVLAGCYYDPATGGTYAYPPAPAAAYGAPPGGSYGAPPSADYGAPPGGGYGAPPAPDYGAPPGGSYGAPPSADYGAPPGGGYGAPPAAAYGAPPGGGYAAPGPGRGITRAQFVESAAKRAQSRNRNPQVAAQRAGALFDQIDTGHTGVVTRAQIRAWRAAHRSAAAPGEGPPPEY